MNIKLFHFEYLLTLSTDPSTPKGITVGTPRSEMQVIDFPHSTSSPQMNWLGDFPEVGK